MAQQKKQKLFKRPEFNNSFAGGLSIDLDVLQQRPNTYRNSLNGRLIFNANGNYGWANVKGNSSAFNLPSGYVPIGWGSTSNAFILSNGNIIETSILIIISTNETNSEIGYVTVDAGNNSYYQTAFNDANDPNGNTFGFSFDHPIRIWTVSESIDRVNIYFSDDYHQPYAFNMVAGLLINQGEITIQPFTANYGATYAGKYPFWYSVQQFQYYCDFAMGRIKFLQRYGSVANPQGNLKTGVFQYFYLYVTKEGYQTPYYPLTRPIFMTDVDLATITTPLSNGYQPYYMSSSNVATPYANQLMIEGLDTRYWQVQIGYVYSIDQNATVEANIFLTKNINPASGANLTFLHTDHTGTPVDVESFNSYPLYMQTAKDMAEKDQRLFWANITTIGDLSINTSSVTVAPTLRKFTADSTGTADGEPFVGTPAVNPTPLIGTAPNGNTPTTVTVQSYINSSSVSVTESYTITAGDGTTVFGDYVNYKGMQFTHLFTGYWRGETYPFCITIYNIKGIPFYSQNLIDYTFPQQYDDSGAYLLTDNSVSYVNLNNGNSASTNKLQAMGAMLSGIEIPSTILYDAFGNLQVSGFSINRCKRVPTILCQGILADTSWDSAGTPDNTELLPFITEDFDTSSAYDPSVQANSVEYDANFESFENGEIGNRPYTFTFHSPDLSFGTNIYAQTGQAGLLPTDVMKKVSRCSNGYGYLVAGTYPAEPYDGQFLAETDNCWYSKNYTTDIFNATAGSTGMGASNYPYGFDSRIELTLNIGFGGSLTPYDPENSSLTFDFAGNVYMTNVPSSPPLATPATSALNASSLGCAGAWGIKLLDNIIASNVSVNHQCAFTVVNYVATNNNYYQSLTSTNPTARIYQGTGHFQPITAAILATLPSTTSGGVTTYTFNGVEVWGGDCYVNFFDFVRLYPEFNTSGTDVSTNTYASYGVAHIIPIESTLNIALRKGRSFGNNCIQPERTAVGSSQAYTNGVSSNQREEFNLNSVLLYQENVQFFAGLPSNVDLTINDFPNRVVYTQEKYYGETIDSYRSIPVDNYQDVVGVYGEIEALAAWGNNIFQFQDTGFGRLRINEQTMISGQNSEAVYTGTGEVLNGVEYLSREYGCQNRFALMTNDTAMYWIDAINLSINRYGSDGLKQISDVKEIHNFTNYELKYFRNPLREVVGGVYKYRWYSIGYDKNNNDIVFSFANNLDTPSGANLNTSITFNESLDVFTDFYSYTPLILMNFQDFLFSNNPASGATMNGCWLHGYGAMGSFYGTVYPSYITPVINVQSNSFKHFDNLVINITQGGYNELTGTNGNLTFVTETQNLSFAMSSVNNEFLYDTIRLQVPVDNTSARITGKSLQLTMQYDNTVNQSFLLTSLKTFWRIVRWAG